jgi:hypothetical protein
MGRIPLKEAIASGAWLECHAKLEEDLCYRVKVLAFDKTSVEEVVRSGLPGPVEGSTSVKSQRAIAARQSRIRAVPVEGILWLLSVEVVNLCRIPREACLFKDRIKLIDEDGFEFEPFESALDYYEGTGLHRFCKYHVPPLSPKVKVNGSIAFVLPDEENSYYLAFKDGNIEEV